MKKICFLFVLFVSCMVHAKAQVGINTVSPLASLHVEAEKTDGTTPEGIIAPKLTRAQLTSKDAQYTASHDGTFVYVTTIDGTPSVKTTNVTTPGYYYFDGSASVMKWKHFNDKIQTADNGLTVTSAAHVQLGGKLLDDTQIDTNGKILTINTGGTATTPIKGIKLTDGNEGLGKVLTSDGTGGATWAVPGATSVKLGIIPSEETRIGLPGNKGGLVTYTGMNITLPPGNYQINFSIWITPLGDVELDPVAYKFASVFLSYSDQIVTPISDYLSPIQSVIIPRLFNSASSEDSQNLSYYGSGAIPIRIKENPPTNETTLYVWTFLSAANYNGPNRQLRSENSIPGDYGPYTQLYAIPFHIQ